MTKNFLMHLDKYAILKTNFGFFAIENRDIYIKKMRVFPIFVFTLSFFVCSAYVFAIKLERDINFSDIYYVLIISCISMVTLSYARISRFILTNALGTPLPDKILKEGKAVFVNWAYIEPIALSVGGAACLALLFLQ